MIDQAWHAYYAGSYSKAAAIARTLLAGVPGDIRAQHLLGMTFFASGDNAQAVEILQSAARSADTYDELWVDLGMVLLALKRPHDAIPAFRAAIGRDANALLGLGHALRDVGDKAGAQTAFVQASEAEPTQPEALLALGMMLLDYGDSLDALEALRRAQALRPADLSIGLKIALAAVKAGLYEEARDAMQAFETKNQTPEVLAMNGLIALETGDIPSAERSLVAALAAAPTLPGARLNLALLREIQGNDSAAEEILSALIASHPNFVQARISRAFARLRRGDYAEGWEDYRAIYEPSVRLNPAPYRDAAPLWDGAHVSRLAIVRDQGIGDLVQMLRFIPEIAKRCTRLVLEVPAEAASLLADVPGVAEIRIESGATCAFAASEIDAYIPLMQVPGLLGIRVSDLPFNRAYLRADAQRRALWKSRIGSPDGSMRVGIIWSSNPRNEASRRRDINARELIEALTMPGVTCYSLQYGGATVQGAIDLGKSITDLSDTAAAMSEMDLIVGVDTGPMHIAGALDIPAILLLHPKSDWRWMRDRNDSPWYPSFTILRRAHGGLWNNVFANLRAMVSSHAAGQE